ncbi:MAG: leucine-rich repeat protein [Treponema sp.]|nr:leucine-rich repeat protein [Treponema sp.]
MKNFFGVFFVAVLAASGLFLSCSDDSGASLFVAPSNTTTTNTTTSTTSTRYYKVTFLSNGGSKIFPQDVQSGKTAIRPNDPTREHYIFDGWYYSDQLFDFSTPVTSDITLIAKWKVVYHSISYESEYGTAPSSIKVLENTVLTSEELPVILCENKVFKGWFNGDGKIREGDVVKNDLVLVAKWSDYVTITYESKFGNVPNSLDIRLNSALTGENLPDVSFYPYTFLGWFYSCDEFGNGTGQVVQVGDVLNVDVTLYAKWGCDFDSLAIAINYMTESSLINVVGAFSSVSLENVNLALRNDVNNKNILVALDLSAVTGLTALPAESFISCKNLTEIVLPDNVTSIGEKAFYECINLASMTIPSSVTSIGEEAFYQCKNLTSVTIPSSVTSIGASAFTGCKNLNVNYTGTLAQWCNVHLSGGIYNVKFCVQEQEIKDLVIPAGLEEINSYTFCGWAGLKSVMIPVGVTSIGSHAFEGTGLTSVAIPSSVTHIDFGAFQSCYELANAIFSDTSGWMYTDYMEIRHSIGVANSTTAALYLRDTYCGYYWYKKN